MKLLEHCESVSISEYFDRLRNDPGLAVVSMSMAAESRGVTRAAIERMIQTGKLPSIRISGTRCVFATDLIEAQNLDRIQIAKVRQILEEHAKLGSIVFYAQVMNPIGLSTNIPAHRNLIGKILGIISEETHKDKNLGVLLSVLVHKKTAGKTKPSDAFFELADSLGYTYEDPNTFVEEQMKRVFEIYRQPV